MYVTRLKPFGVHNRNLITQRRIEHYVDRPAGRGVETPRIGAIYERRTYIRSSCQIIKAGEFAERPVRGFLLEPCAQIRDPVACGGICITVVGVELGPRNGLQRS